jgi:hypothetical protein
LLAKEVVHVAAHAGTFAHVPAYARRTTFVDVFASAVGYVATIAFVGALLSFAAFGIAFAVHEVSGWAI